MNIIQRPRRNRKSAVVRALVEETKLSIAQLIFPIFVQNGTSKTPVSSMPGIFRHSISSLLNEIADCMQLGIKTFCLFPAIAENLKDRLASASEQTDNVYLKAIRAIKENFPAVCVMTDVAMDPYSSDGHDGLCQNGIILNDDTLPILGKMALAQAGAGADIIGPSDMMDGRVAYIRKILDQAGFKNVSIMAYTAKYASAFYAPFRDALGSIPKTGDKKTYQMNPANSKEALREATLDTQEGADILMVKPALFYLDVIKALKDTCHLPIAAYSVSGEYAMIKAAASYGFLDETNVMLEGLLSIKRAGADIILSYFAKTYAQWLQKGG